MFLKLHYILLIWNTLVFLIYGADKLKAKKGKRRIRETVLVFPAFIMASVGAMLGMIIFNHKTSKTKFRILIPLSFIENIALVYFILNL